MEGIQGVSVSLDVAIVGGGAAGIAAARALQAARRSVLLIEALPRLGGRAHTVTIQGMPLDLGCGWLHSAERNPLTLLAEAQGYTIDRSQAAWGRQWRNLQFPAEQQKQAWEAYEQLIARLHSNPPPNDCAGDAIGRDDRWRPFINGLSGFINGAELDHISVADFLAYDDAASECNWRLPSGYGAFIAGLGADVPLALATRVNAVSQGDDIKLETDRGAIQAKAAIIAISSNVLAKGAIQFTPDIDAHLHAASNLPLGLANKIYLSLATPDAIPAESHLLGRYDSAETGSYYMRPFGRPVIECFLGGGFAQNLEKAGDAAAIAFATDELRQLLGADFARGLTPLAVTRWAHEASIGGSYSHALPGHAEARATLARPVNERLCFAGEACSQQDYSTAHGAWASGLQAAAWIEDGLAKQRA
jgi:monoamine oxidase